MKYGHENAIQTEKLIIDEILRKNQSNKNKSILKISIDNFNKISSLLIIGYENIDLEKIFLLDNLRFLTMKYCKIRDIPKSIKNLKNLVELDLSSNKISKIDLTENYSPSITILNLSNNKIDNIIFSKGKFTRLSKLDLSNNYLKIIPDTIYTLYNLITLDLSNNCIEKLNDSIFLLKRLEFLNLNGNYIPKIPQMTFSLKCLKKICLEGNPLIEPILFSKDFNQSLKIEMDYYHWNLILKGNSLIFENIIDDPYLSDEFLSDSGVSYTLLRILLNNRVTLFKDRKIQDPLVDFTNQNKREVINEWIINNSFVEEKSVIDTEKSIVKWFLDKLGRIPLINNSSVSEITPEIGFQLKNKSIVCLKINNKFLRKLPSNIGNLRNLEILIIDGNNIRELPESIYELSNVRTLVLSGNPIQMISHRIQELKNLEILKISCIPFTEYPWDIVKLPNLKTIDIGCWNNIPKKYEKLVDNPDHICNEDIWNIRKFLIRKNDFTSK